MYGKVFQFLSCLVEHFITQYFNISYKGSVHISECRQKLKNKNCYGLSKSLTNQHLFLPHYEYYLSPNLLTDKTADFYF